MCSSDLGPLVAKTTGKHVLFLCRRLEGPDGRFAGAVIAQVGVEYLEKYFSSFKLGSTGIINLRTLDLAQVARYPAVSGPGGQTGNRNVSTTILDLMRESPGQADYTYRAVAPIDNVERIYTYHRLDHSPFYMTVGRATADFGGAWIERWLLLFGIWAMTVLSAIGFAVRQYAQACRISQERAAADRENEAKTAFLASVSHELRTPLNAVLGHAYLLSREGLNGAQRAHLERITDASHHVKQIVNDLLDLVKIDAGQFGLVEADFSLHQLCADVQSYVEDAADRKGLALSCETGDAPDAVRGDALRLKQCLLNYLSNAIKFTQHGTVRLSVRVVEDHGSELLLRCEVRDTGVGIARERVGELFRAFGQVGRPTMYPQEGTGLGLAITRALVQKMGGDVGVESEPGVGSTF